MLMKRKALTLTLSLSFSAVAGGLFVDVGKANFTPLPELPPPIYIRNDGSVEPSSTCIQRVGDTYTFTDDIDNSIEVQRDNIVIDGNGFSITQTPVNTSELMIPAGWYPGIRLTDRRSVTIKNVKIHDCISGITIETSTNITLTNNSITDIDKIAIFSASSKNCTISQNNIKNSDQGILIIDSMYINVFENNIIRNSVGIQCYTYTYSPKPDGGVTSGCAYIDIFGNYIAGNTQNGISLSAFYTRIGYNTLAKNNKGIRFSGDSFHTMIYHNNFISNSKHVDIAVLASGGGGTWIWNGGSEGNYWSDYLTKYPNATEKNHSGVGNMPYVIHANNVDNYPLMKEVSINPPYAILEFPSSLPNPSPFSSPAPSPFSTPTLSPTPSQEPTSTPETKQIEPFPVATVAVASAVSVSFVGLGFLFYFKRSRTKNNRADNK
jgi:parallel beta-helix repeat protein